MCLICLLPSSGCGPFRTGVEDVRRIDRRTRLALEGFYRWHIWRGGWPRDCAGERGSCAGSRRRSGRRFFGIAKRCPTKCLSSRTPDQIVFLLVELAVSVRRTLSRCAWPVLRPDAQVEAICSLSWCLCPIKFYDCVRAVASDQCSTPGGIAPTPPAGPGQTCSHVDASSTRRNTIWSGVLRGQCIWVGHRFSYCQKTSSRSPRRPAQLPAHRHSLFPTYRQMCHD